MADFSARLIAWQIRHGRHDLPWQGSRDPYRIWLSEVMLQQTQAATVIPYYVRFLARFPNVAALAAAPLEEVMALWSGLGYYARARNLHRAARKVIEDRGGRFPDTASALVELPGIGRSTAAAIAAFSRGERAAILDGNVKRVLCRVFGIEGFPEERALKERLWMLAEALLPEHPENIGAYIQAQMDLGATVCRRAKPACEHCPLAAECIARISGRITELPTRRPRKTPPRRISRVAVVIYGKNVLLERRPPAGIWGGLLALPEIPVETGIQAWAARRFGFSEIGVRELPALTHGFTHFTLEIAPWRIELPAPPRALAEPAWQWLAFERIAAAALPAPVRKILEKSLE
ncbi:MAG: A/G-specific adenine glycosylase [Azoarcus sp.]|jgi:A/G-specific adenine glycosylase|nr:A/G-specific adenine glycosylase [Azoarcus sp.]